MHLYMMSSEVISGEADAAVRGGSYESNLLIGHGILKGYK